MIIRKIRLKNINSLKGEHIIDFTLQPFSNNTLFAITGPTGSGKTTILDAICLALYNRIPRLKTGISKTVIQETGVILNHNTKDCYAEVEFSCYQGNYTSRWEISTNRNGALRDYEMRLYNNEGIVIEEKKTNVPEHIEKLIGLNFDQFTKSIMLPQGDFALFLKSNKHDRGKLLEKITGSSIYRELGQKAFLKSKEIDLELDFIKKRVSVLSNEKIDDDTFNEIKEKSILIDKEHSELQNQISEIKQMIAVKRNIARLEKETLDAKNNYNAKKNEISTFNEVNGEKINKYQQLIPYVDSVNDVINIEKQININRVKLNDITKQLEENTKNDIKITTDIEILTKPIDKTSDSPIDNLNEFENKIKELNSIINQSETEYRAEFKTIKELLKDIGLNILLNEEPQLIAEKISDKRKSTIFSINVLEQKHPKIHVDSDAQNIDKLNQLLEKVLNWEKENITIKHSQKSIDELNNKINSIKNEIELKRQLIHDLNNKLEITTSKLKQKENELKVNQLEAKLENIRQQLKNGEPCPVCGSKDHPWSGKSLSETSQLEKEITELSKVVGNDKSQIDFEIGRMEQNTINISALEKEIKSLQNKKEELIKRTDYIRTEQFAITKQNDPSEAAIFIKNQINDAQTYSLLLVQLQKIEKTKTIISDLLRIFVSAKQLKQAKEKIYNGIDITNDCKILRDRYSDINNEKVRLLRTQKELEKETETNEKLKERKLSALLPKLEKLGYLSVNEALAFIIPTEQYNNLNNKIQQLYQDLSKLQAVFETLYKQLQQSKIQDVDKSEKEMTVRLDQLNVYYTSLMADRDSLKEKLITQNNIRKELSESEIKISEINKRGERWILLNSIIGDANGNRFNNIAQSLTLKHLINKANKCILELNPRYRLELSDSDDDDAILVVDLDLGHQKRSTRTLSGGETFLVSLSLALGLADMVSKEKTIGNLFIDEGFGTLDPETLDQAVAMLESLQAKGNKNIGIISHVETLKERINARIDLVPVAGQGYSKMIITS